MIFEIDGGNIHAAASAVMGDGRMEAAVSHIEKPGERDSHKSVPIAVTPHRLIAAEVPLELSLAKPNATITLSVASLSVIYGPLEPEKSPHGSDRRENKRFKHPYI